MQLEAPDVAKLFGVKRSGIGTVAAYKDSLTRDPCSYCGTGPTGHGRQLCQVDHITARATGGPNHWTNYTGACWLCNRCKLDQPFLIWLLDLCGLRESTPNNSEAPAPSRGFAKTVVHGDHNEAYT